MNTTKLNPPKDHPGNEIGRLTVDGAKLFRRPDARCVFLLLCLSVLLWLPRLRGSIDLRYDAGVYYITGTALAQGEGYRLLSEPGDIRAVQYPPGLPLLVAVHQWMLGTADPDAVGPWLRLTYFLIFLVYIQATYALARRSLAPLYASLVALITALYLQTIFLSDLLFAELPFALVAVLFVLCNRRSGRPGWFALTGLLGVSAYLLRTAGVALLAAWVAESVFKREAKQLILRVAVALVPVVAWQAYLSHVKAGEEYCHPAYIYQRAAYQFYNVSYTENILLIDPFVPERGRASPTDLLGRVSDNLVAMPASLGEGLTRGKEPWKWLLRIARDRGSVSLPDWIAAIPNLLVGGPILIGVVVLLSRREWFVPFYLASALGLICLTPWPGQFNRYLTPLTPFLALCLFQAMTFLQAYTRSHRTRWGPRAGSIIPWLVIAGVLGTELATDLHGYLFRHGPVYAPPGQENGGRLFYYNNKWAEFDAAVAWLRGQARPGDIVATTAPHWVFLKTGLRSVMPPMEANLKKAQRLLDSVPAKYVILDELEFIDVIARYTGPTIREHPDLWQRVYTVPGSSTYVYQRVERAGLGPVPAHTRSFDLAGRR